MHKPRFKFNSSAVRQYLLDEGAFVGLDLGAGATPCLLVSDLPKEGFVPVVRDGDDYVAVFEVDDYEALALANPYGNRYLELARGRRDAVIETKWYEGKPKQPGREKLIVGIWGLELDLPAAPRNEPSRAQVAEWVRIDEEWKARKKAGRPPKEVVEARRGLASIDRLSEYKKVAENAVRIRAGIHSRTEVRTAA